MRWTRLRGIAIGCLRVRIGVVIVGGPCRMLRIKGTLKRWDVLGEGEGGEEERRGESEERGVLAVKA